MNRFDSSHVFLLVAACFYLFGLSGAASADQNTPLLKAISDLTSQLKSADPAQLKSNSDVQTALAELQTALTCTQTSSDCRVKQIQNLIQGWTDTVTLTDAQAAAVNKAMTDAFGKFGSPKGLASGFINIGVGYFKDQKNKSSVDKGLLHAFLTNTTSILSNIDPTTIDGTQLIADTNDLAAKAIDLINKSSLVAKNDVDKLNVNQILTFAASFRSLIIGIEGLDSGRLKDQILEAELDDATKGFSALPGQYYQSAVSKLNALLKSALDFTKKVGDVSTRTAVADIVNAVFPTLQQTVQSLPAQYLDSAGLLKQFNTLGGAVTTAVRTQTSNSGAMSELPIGDTVKLAQDLATATEMKGQSGTDKLQRDIVTADLVSAIMVSNLIASNPDTKIKFADFSLNLTTLYQNMAKLQNSAAGVDVLGAWYGDVRLIQAKLGTGGLTANAHDDRYCAATLAVRSWCQGKSGCFAPNVQPGTATTPPTAQYPYGDPTKAPFAGAYFCGYDPAPYAEDSVKGLVVAYRCRALPSEAWDQQPATWSYIERDREPVPRQAAAAVLRVGMAGELRCSGVAGATPK